MYTICCISLSLYMCLWVTVVLNITCFYYFNMMHLHRLLLYVQILQYPQVLGKYLIYLPSSFMFEASSFVFAFSLYGTMVRCILLLSFFDSHHSNVELTVLVKPEDFINEHSQYNIFSMIIKAFKRHICGK